MNLSWLILSFISTLHWTKGAPAVSSVHVSFVSGNKATAYSHGSGGGDGTLIQYDVLEKSGIVGEDATVRRKRTPPLPPILEGLVKKKTSPNRTPSPLPTTTMPVRVVTIRMPTATTSTRTARGGKETAYTNRATDKTFDDAMELQRLTSTTAAVKRKGEKKRVRFVMAGAGRTDPSTLSVITTTAKTATTTQGAEQTTNPVTMTGSRLDSELKATASSKDETGKLKDTKAVKRSPFLGDNFVGSFDFPNFDDFGGSGFGSSLRNFRGRVRGGGNEVAGSRGSYSSHNPESLAPEGVFHPPLPTEATHYVGSDPYLADPDTAKYAAQHPPFFSEFPHKRTVLALNERRENNGLEPNILRSIRPFFPFFEVSNSL